MAASQEKQHKKFLKSSKPQLKQTLFLAQKLNNFLFGNLGFPPPRNAMLANYHSFNVSYLNTHLLKNHCFLDLTHTRCVCLQVPRHFLCVHRSSSAALISLHRESNGAVPNKVQLTKTKRGACGCVDNGNSRCYKKNPANTQDGGGCVPTSSAIYGSSVFKG